MPKKLLIVEDNAVVRQGLAVLLEREGYEVALSAEGRQALGDLECSPRPDLVLLDMLLPILDGWRFLEELQSLQPPLTAPIIIVTGSDAIGHDWAQAHGCAGLLRKPIEMEALLAEIRRCLAEDSEA